MKRSISFLLIFLFTFHLFCQVEELNTTIPAQENYDYYLLKHKNQKTTGTILLVAGLLSAGGGIALMASNITLFSTEQSPGFKAGTGLFFVGSAATIISIPVLVSSGTNKRKAEAFLSKENVGFIGSPEGSTHFVSLGVNIYF